MLRGDYLGAAGHAGLFGVEAFGLRGIGKLQGAGKVRGGVVRPTKNAYKLAKAGGKHKGMYENYLKRSTEELEKSIRSYQSRKEGDRRPPQQDSRPKEIRSKLGHLHKKASTEPTEQLERGD